MGNVNDAMTKNNTFPFLRDSCHPQHELLAKVFFLVSDVFFATGKFFLKKSSGCEI